MGTHENEIDPHEVIADLRSRLEQAEETMRAIRAGEVDALVVSGEEGARVYTLQSAETPYRVLVEQMQEGAITLSQEGIILYCNLRFSEMLKVPHGRLVATQIRDYVSAETSRKFRDLLRSAASKAVRGEVRFMSKGGGALPTFVAASPLPPEAEGAICMVVTDLTEQESLRRSQSEIQELNEQLRRTMRETHHRVKNNLQIIASIVDMQIIEGGESVPTDDLRRVALHTRTLAAVHDLLTRNANDQEDTQYVSSRAVLDSLIKLIRQTASGRTFETHIEDTTLTARQGTSLAIVMSEIVTNAIKHGRGRVEVGMTIEDGLAMCEVSDDGEGFPANFDVTKNGNTGLDLVEQVTRWDLSGCVTYANRPEGGACVRLRIPVAR